MTNGTSNNERILMRWVVGIMLGVISMGLGHVTTKTAMHEEFSEATDEFVPRVEVEARLADIKAQLNRIEANQRSK